MDHRHPRDPGGARLTVNEGAVIMAYERAARIVTPCQQHSPESRFARAELVVEQVDPQGRLALSLLQQAAIEARELYPELAKPGNLAPTNPPAPDRGVYLVAFVDGKGVACGALRPIDAEVAEVRRMFVQRGSRRHGYAKAILIMLEEYAGIFGYSILRLETGDRQHAAIALYESYGFHRTAPFGEYMNDVTSVCFEKRVTERRVP